MDYAMAAMIGSVTDVIGMWVCGLGVLIGAVVAIAWIKADQ